MKIKNLHETSTSTSANFYCGICSLGIWNKEYSSRNPEFHKGLDWNQESKFHRQRIRNPVPGSRIQDPEFQIPLKKIWNLVIGIRNPRCGIQTSKTALHFLTWADQLACSAGQGVSKRSWHCQHRLEAVYRLS